MRSAPSSSRNHPIGAPLLEVARFLDHTTVDHPGHLLLHLPDTPGPDLDVGLLPLDVSTHPFAVAAGFTAPDDWRAFGVRVRGRAHRQATRVAPTPTTATFLVARTGEEASILRSGPTVEAVSEPAEGVLPDLCRRVLGLPTSPPPTPDTQLLWTTIWLDRIMTAWSDPEQRRRLRSGWPVLAGLHPAAVPGSAEVAELVTCARGHATAWPWERLRSEPSAAPLPDGPLPATVSAWMDDGFYARWALGAFPSALDLVADLLPLLEDPARTHLAEALADLLGGRGPGASYAARRASP